MDVIVATIIVLGACIGACIAIAWMAVATGKLNGKGIAAFAIGGAFIAYFSVANELAILMG